VLCSHCSTVLPDGGQFCLQCGRPVVSSANSLALAPVLRSGLDRPAPMRARRRWLIVPWLVVLLLLGAAVWVATSETPAAQQVQEFVHWAHTQTIVDTALSVNPHSFSSCEFTVPRGGLSISIVGEFSETPATPRKVDKSLGATKDLDANIEAYVLTDAAFAVWRSGYSAQTQYESGPVASATINAPLPAGGGVYHLVFSNRNSARATTVHATVLLRYKNWLPDALVHLKEQFWNWLGL
jgi:hypothetical protein